MEALSPGDSQRIGDHWLAGRLGSGGQGVVHDAYDDAGNRVAVKVLHVAADSTLRAIPAGRRDRRAVRRARLRAARREGGEPSGRGPHRNHPVADPAGKRLLLPGDRLDQIALPGWRSERPFAACAKRPQAVAIGDDGKTLACGGRTDIALVDAVSGRPRGAAVPCDACGTGGRLRFSQDGRHLVSFRGRDVQVWDLRTRHTVLDHRADGEPTDVASDPSGGILPALPRAAGEVDFLAFSPDGKTLATASLDGVLQLWDIPARRRLGGSYLVRAGRPWSLAFNADGTALHAGMEGAVRTIPVDGRRVPEEACDRVGRTLTPAEWDRYLGGAPYQDVCRRAP
ncbi:protein kinase family protein [Nonomuraea sp. NPDC052634]|uniref:WD40 repeat domain-containing protein n=1 Tax=Nonomuraea sp. NPDC052634 TaxID=3155813 RepID=UPI00343EC601